MCPSLPLNHLPRRELLALAAGASVLSACSHNATVSQASASATTSPQARSGAATEAGTGFSAPQASAAPTPSASPTADVLAGWSLEHKVGQLLMVGAEAASGAGAAEAVSQLHVGGVFLSGRSEAGVGATRAVVDSVTALVGPESTNGVGLLVATDQEGGAVQVLRGQGFSAIPDALSQAGLGAGGLEAAARGWGEELAGAGVNLNLAPVADLVDLADPGANAPIGAFGREYGHDLASVRAAVEAFAAGMEQAGVAPTLKHFPGLGRVAQNTDASAGVVDTVTGADDPVAAMFAELAGASGKRLVMLSSAYYSLIDAQAPAVFSSGVVTDLLRGTLGFGGVVITDDVSAAAQLSGWDPGERAVAAVRAGCDIVLASGAPWLAPEMASALLATAQADAGFAAQVDAAVTRVLALKQALGLASG